MYPEITTDIVTNKDIWEYHIDLATNAQTDYEAKGKKNKSFVTAKLKTETFWSNEEELLFDEASSQQ